MQIGSLLIKAGGVIYGLLGIAHLVSAFSFLWFRGTMYDQEVYVNAATWMLFNAALHFCIFYSLWGLKWWGRPLTVIFAIYSILGRLIFDVMVVYLEGHGWPAWSWTSLTELSFWIAITVILLRKEAKQVMCN